MLFLQADPVCKKTGVAEAVKAFGRLCFRDCVFGDWAFRV